MPTFFEILQGTPVWVWGIFAYLMVIGTQAMRARTVHWYRLSVMPLIFVTWSLYSMYGKYDFVAALKIWLPLCGAGILAGYYSMRQLGVTLDKRTSLVHMPGSVVPLVLSLSFFSIKYFLGVVQALHLALYGSWPLLIVDVAVSGLISGISLGRFLRVLKLYFNDDAL